MKQSLIAPHGGTLINRELQGEAREKALEHAQTMPKIVLSDLNIADLEMITNGGLSPLTGYMGKADYENVVHHMRLNNGLPWTITVTLVVESDVADTLQIGTEIALVEEIGNTQRILAILELSEKFVFDKEIESQNVYRTTDGAHPGVARVYKQGNIALAGDIWLIHYPQRTTSEFPDIRYTPAQTRAIFAERGWRKIVGFQTRNPIHRAHEYIQKTALEIVDGLLLHPLVGETKSDDIPANVRVESYRAIISAHYPPSRVLLGVFPAAMRYAGPREAIWHAIARKNYGCSHFIVGRDHAGVGKYYGTYDAQLIFDEFESHEIGITPLMFENTFYCKQCATIVSSKTCPHDSSHHLILSGTQVRTMLRNGQDLPLEFTRPEVSKILMDHARQPVNGTV